MKEITLSRRLKVIADKIKNNRIICDVGTDHAYLPIYLVGNNISPKAIACDIEDKPLEIANKNITKYNMQEKIKLIKSNGLDSVPKADFDDVVIAGMGGELICEIIEKSSYLKDSKVTLYLQPMTRSHILREFLHKNKFEIIDEDISLERDKLFEIITAKYNADIKPCNKADFYYNKIHTEKNLYQLLDKQINKLQKIALCQKDNIEIQKILEELKKRVK